MSSDRGRGAFTGAVDHYAGPGAHRRSRPGSRYALVSVALLALLVAPLAIAAGEGDSIRGGERNPTHSATQALTKETEIIANTTTYGTRQSNKNPTDGGGAVYGCRAVLNREPCIRANNLNTGRAFEFQATKGTQGGFIRVGAPTPNPAATPFGTNASKRVANLNSDMVDGKHAADLVNKADLLYAVVSATGALIRGHGATSSSASGFNATVVFNRNVSTCAYQATVSGSSTAAGNGIAVQENATNVNAVDVNQQSLTTPAPGPQGFHLAVTC